MKNKYIRGLALGMAAMTAFTFTTPNASLLSVEAAAATKATKGTSKITASAKTVKVAKGKTKTVKLTLNKKQAKDLKITVKSKSTKIAKVTNASKVIVKKGKKVASVKIKGVKANSNTKVTASFKTSAGKTKKVTITVNVNPIALTKVALNNKTPKVGDKLTATITPSNASAVTYKWYMGDSASKVTTVISGQTKKTLTVTEDMAGKFIKVTATGKTAAGKAANKSATTTAAVEATQPDTPVDEKVAVTGVTLSTTAPKVGDTVTATVTPENATNVKYAWYLGNSSNGLTDVIAGETAKEIKITKEMVGKYLGVVVSGENNSSANAATAVAIQEADSTQIAITKAEQTGAKTIKVTFNNPVTSSDKLSVKKGSDNIAIDGAVDYAADFMSATLTLADKITTSEYEVTLTPADTKVAATSAKFTGQISQLKEIKFLNDYLVMKDHNYKEGYAYAKGFDQFGGEVTLSGLTVNSGVGEFKSYDNTTGKITIVDNSTNANSTGAFMLIKEVPVFIQYQQGNDVISAQKTLTVSTRSYVSDVEFGEIKKDGTPRSDGRLTMTELRSGKYYLELNKVKDQYGNDLTAEDLNDQRNDANGQTVLFVIPGNTGAFYKTVKFGTMNNKVVLWLSGDGNSKPGTMPLTLTGAGGATFTKDITILDDPYIDTLNISYPELYENQQKSSKLEFSALDQYGVEVNLWDVKPEIYVDTNGVKQYNMLVFTDRNNMTGQATTIQASGVTFNEVLTDAEKKSFSVTINATGAKAKSVAVFTATTAGMKVAPRTITIGEEGIAAKVKSDLKAGTDTQLTGVYGDNQKINFNEKVQFEDANGNSMIRGISDQYPRFMNLNTTVVSGDLLKEQTGSVKSYDGGYWWSLTDKKVKANTVSGSSTWIADADGVITRDELDKTASSSDSYHDYYVTVFGKNGTNYYILDDQDFHITKLTGKKTDSITASCDGKIYATVGSKDDAEIKVIGKTDNGETYTVNPSKIEIIASGQFKATPNTNKVYSNLSKELKEDTDTTVTLQVYAEGLDGKKLETTVTVPYGNKEPVATKARYHFDTDASDSASKVGADFDGDLNDVEFETVTTGAITIADGVMTITKANKVNDKFTLSIRDQYDQDMKGTKFYWNGTEIKTSTGYIPAERNPLVFSYDNVSGKIYENFKYRTPVTFNNSETVDGSYELISKVGKENQTVTLSTSARVENSLTVATGSTLNVPANVTLEVESPSIVNVCSGAVININGKAYFKGGLEAKKGQIKGDGHLEVSGTVIATDGTTFNVGGTTLVFKNANLAGDFKLGGNVEFIGGTTVSGGTEIIVMNGAKLTDAPTATYTVEKGSSATINETSVGTSTGSDAQNATVEVAGNSVTVTGKGTTQNGVSTESETSSGNVTRKYALQVKPVSGDTFETASGSVVVKLFSGSEEVGTINSESSTITSGITVRVQVTSGGTSCSGINTGAVTKTNAVAATGLAVKTGGSLGAVSGQYIEFDMPEYETIVDWIKAFFE